MTDKNTRDVIPATPITPLPTPPVGMPRVPVTLFNVWTWNSPVIPQFYWNVYSAEQRIKEICKQIGKIGAYLDYAASKINEANVDMIEQINKIYEEISKQLGDLTNKLTSEVTRLEGLITAEAETREAADAALRNDLTAETQARTAADAKLTTDLQAETAAREDADETLHTELSAETTARTHADDQLHAEISAETTARGEAISALTTRVATEESNRQAEDGKLGARIDSTNAAVQNNASAIITETRAREAADTAINQSLATRLVRDDIRASGKITLTPGEGNTVTIGDTFEADFSALQSAISGLQAALQSETSERRHDDQQLQTAVDARLERGKLLAGEGIEVVNDPDKSTVTVSAKVTDTDLSGLTAKVTTAQQTADSAKSAAQNAQSTADQAKAAAEAAQRTADGKLSAVAVGAGLTGDGTTGSPVTLDAATASTIGGVKVGSGLTVTADGTLSATNHGGGTSGLTAVAHDSSLKGDGSSGSPLGVAAAPQGALTAGDQGLAVNAGEGLSISDNKIVAEVTQAELTAVEGKADAAQSAATQAGSKADAATEAASQAGTKADAAKTAADTAQEAAEAAQSAATQAGSKADAASQAATQAGSKADAAKTAADEAKAAAEGKLSTVAVRGPLTGDGTTGSPLDVNTATAASAGVITENRVKELAGLDSITADKPLSVRSGSISLRMKAPLGTDSDGELYVHELSGSSDQGTGVTSISTIRDCFGFRGPLKQEGGAVTLQLKAPLGTDGDGELYVHELSGSSDQGTGVTSISTIRDCFSFRRPLKQEGGVVTLPLEAPLGIDSNGELKVKELDSGSSNHREAGVVSIDTIREILQMFIKPEAFKD